MKTKALIVACTLCVSSFATVSAQNLQLNGLEYFETRGVNVLVYSNNPNGGFNDEKNTGIEIIHHGVRTVQGGAVRLSNTPEQWDLVPETPSRVVNKENGSIEVSLRYKDYDFDSRLVVTANGDNFDIEVWLDKPLKKASVWRINDDGSETKCFEGKTQVWGAYYKYNYVKFDFSAVQEQGVHYIKYGNTRTVNFLIDSSVYDQITDATSDVWIPIHMNHMTVNEGYRIWHGEPFKEGYLQAPAPTDHFDLHSQGATPATLFSARPSRIL